MAVLTASVIQAQETVRVSGQVLAGSPATPVAGAVVSAGEREAVSGQDGTFSLEVSTKNVTLTVSASGFVAETVAVTEDTAGRPLLVTLRRATDFREDVLVSGESSAELASPPVLVLSPVQVSNVAGAADNVFKVLQTLPGVGATDDFGSRLTVRGGGPDQNLTVMDGVEIHNPYRLFGLTSAFNPETVQSFELTAGGFGVEYGDRLSSILVLENRAGTADEGFAGSAAMSLTDTNVVLEGKLPGVESGSWLVTGRRTYYDLVAERITDNDLPSFADVQTKLSWRPRPGTSITLFGLRSRETTDAEFEDGADRIGLKNESLNDVVSVSVATALGPRAALKTIASWYRFGDGLDVDGSVRNDARRSNAPDDESLDQAAIVFTRDLVVRDVSLRNELTVTAGRRHVIGAGAEIHGLETRWGWRIDGERNPSAANPSSIQGGTALPSLLDSLVNSVRGAVWVKDALRLTPRVRLEPGVRVDWSGVSKETVVSPRIGFLAELTPHTRVRGALGLYTQSPGYEKLLQSDYFVDLSDQAGPKLSSERSRHFVGAVEHDFSAALIGRLEMYVKQFDRMIVGRLETPEQAAARIAQYAFPAAIGASVPTAPAITSLPANIATGDSYGFDLFVEKRPVSPDSRVNGWASYSWGKAEVDAYGRRFSFDYDRRHSLSLVGGYRLKPRLEVGGTLRVASGFPVTLPVGVRVDSVLAPGSTEGAPRSLVPAVDEAGRYIWTTDFGGVDNINGGRVPVFARLDLRVTFGPARSDGRWQVYVEVLNALNRDNSGRVDAVLEYDPASDRPRVAYERQGGLPLLPSFGIRYRF